MLLKGENGVSMEIEDKIRIKLEAIGNVKLVNESYNPVKIQSNAKYVEWMIKGSEALQDFLSRIALRYDKHLGNELRQKISEDKEKIISEGKKILNSERNNKIEVKFVSIADKEIQITIKWVKGMWRDFFPAMNIVFPIKNCRVFGKTHHIYLTLEEAKTLGYDILFWISASEIADKKDWTTAEKVLGKLNF